MGTGRGFRVVLDAVDGFGFVAHAFDGLVVEVDAVDGDIFGKAGSVDSETVVLGSDFDFAGFEILDGLIGTAVAEFQFEGFSAEGLAKNLVAEANAEDGNAGVHEFLHFADDVGQGGGIARSV